MAGGFATFGACRVKKLTCRAFLLTQEDNLIGLDIVCSDLRLAQDVAYKLFALEEGVPQASSQKEAPKENESRTLEVLSNIIVSLILVAC